MSKITKFSSSRPTLLDNASILSRTSLNALSFRRIVSRASPSVSIRSRGENFFLLDANSDLNFINRSILIGSANQQRGFLPSDYRMLSTMETVRQQRVAKKMPPVVNNVTTQKSTHFDTFGNSVQSMNKLSEQRLILREKSRRKKHNSTPIDEHHPRSPIPPPLSHANFVGDIPNALELIMHQKKKSNSSVEQYLYESLQRERLQHARYRLLPITRAALA